MTELEASGSPDSGVRWLLEKIRQVEALASQLGQPAGRDDLLPLVFSALGAVEAMEVSGAIEASVSAEVRARLEAVGLQTQSRSQRFSSTAPVVASRGVSGMPEWLWSHGIHRLGTGLVLQGIAAECWPDLIRVTGRVIEPRASSVEDIVDETHGRHLFVSLRTTNGATPTTPATAISSLGSWWILAVADLPPGHPRPEVVGLDFVSASGSVHVWLGRQVMP